MGQLAAVLLVELADLDETLALFASLEADPVDGIEDMVPAARTLMIRFRADMLTAEALAAAISHRDLSAKIPPSDMLVEIPVTYDGEDLRDVAELTGLSVEEVIERHTASEFTVAFCGFAPGFGYLVGGDPALQVPRRQSPRTKIPAGSVALAGAFSGVYPQASPGGWQIIGTTPVKMWDLTREPPALFQPGYRVRFFDLAKGLGSLGVWTRMHYVYPYPHVDNIIPLMAEGLITPYLDIPFQHASAPVLKAMKRPGNQDKVLARIAKWRSDVPDLAIRSTFIVGFPGETEEDFQYLLDWMTEAQLDRVGCFQYSPVEGAPANKLDGIVPDEVKQERWERFMEHQQAISTARLAAKVGREMDVLIDEIDEDGDAVGRSSADAPEIDGNVFITSEQKLEPGQMVRVRITDSSEYDLFGETS
mgnify:CR=1 FL=1